MNINLNQLAEIGVNSSDDGSISKITDAQGDSLEAIVEFDVEAEMAMRIRTACQDVVFSARSRIARLGINVTPISPLHFKDQNTIQLKVAICARAYGNQVWPLARPLFVPGLPVGRLVDCPSEEKLTSVQIFEGYENNEFKVPRGFSIDEGGRIIVPSHPLVYEFVRPLTQEDISTILYDADGKALLNRLQQGTAVDNVVVRPGEGIVTSCSMFLYDHFAVLDTKSLGVGHHLDAVVLDPFCTSGTSIFLEVFNGSDEVIVNPTVYASLFRVKPKKTKPARREQWQPSYEKLSAAFGSAHSEKSYCSRSIGYSTTADPLQVSWLLPKKNVEPFGAEKQYWNRSDSSNLEFASTQILQLPNSVEIDSLFFRYFPNLREHVDVMQLIRDRSIRKIFFLNASFRHRYYLSARDHSRLADYEDVGVEVYWLNQEFGHLAKHVYRGQRGFFCEADKIQDLYSSLVLAVYGSSNSLSAAQTVLVDSLLQKLHHFFGRQLSILTGGGPGVMHAVSEIGKRLNMTVGANYLEIEDQQSNRLGDFYQVFQENCRHSRQRWFEVSNFHLFLIGGVGTLEEIGVTLTDIKLGIAEQIPIVFFGSATSELYWDALRKQLELMVKEGRAPKRILENVLVSADPDEVISFYKSRMHLG